MKNEMDWACSMYGGGMHTRVWWGNLLDRDPLEDQSVDGRIILSASSRSGMWGVDWIDLAQKRDR